MSSKPPPTGGIPSDPAEAIKAQSNFGRGRIVEELAEPGDHFSEETAQLLKLHGIYQQDDRDLRAHFGDSITRGRKTFAFMLRTQARCGRISSDQLLTHLDLADELGNGTVRITTRQNLQLHGLAKQDLKPAIRRINQCGLTTRATCGDVLRSVVCCPAPHHRDPVHGQMLWLANRILTELAPRLPSYDDIWLSDNSPPAAPRSGDEQEPLYGKCYLPRKFKVAIGLPGDNCADIYAQDVGLMAICEDFHVIGYNILVGGGMGMTPTRPETFPVLAQRMAFATPEQAFEAVRAILQVFRDFGDRTNRRHARLKYLVADWGLAAFRAKVESYLGYALGPLRPDEVWDIDDHLGWREQGDGAWFYGLHVDCGRIADSNGGRLKSALREIGRKFQPTIILTPGQSLLLADVRWEDRLGLEDVLRRHEVRLEADLTNVRRWSAACVSLPTCPKAITESERALPDLLEHLETELAKLGLGQERFSLRMTGCTNGCSRPFNADLGIVGRSMGRYAIYLGGCRLGTRLGFLYRDSVPLEQIVATLTPLLAYFKQVRHEGESFGDFCQRTGREELLEKAQAMP